MSQLVPAGTRLSGAVVPHRHPPRFFNEKSCLKLVFATLWQASQRRQNVRLSDAEYMLLDRLRCELGLDKKEAQPSTMTHPNPLEAAA